MGEKAHQRIPELYGMGETPNLIIKIFEMPYLLLAGFRIFVLTREFEIFGGGAKLALVSISPPQLFLRSLTRL